MSQTQIQQTQRSAPQQQQQTQGGGANPSGQQTQQTQNTANNAGQNDDILAEFWSDEPETTPAQQQNQVGGQQQQQQQVQQQQPPNAEQLMNQFVSQINFGEVPEDAIEALSNGDTSRLNQHLAEMNRQSVRQSMMATGAMLSQMQTKMLAAMKEMLQQNTQAQGLNQYLDGEFGDADPLVKPVIRSVFDQAMKRSKGDQKKAMEVTRAMLQKLGVQTGKSKANQTAQDSLDWANELGLTKE